MLDGKVKVLMPMIRKDISVILRQKLCTLYLPGRNSIYYRFTAKGVELYFQLVRFVYHRQRIGNNR